MAALLGEADHPIENWGVGSRLGWPGEFGTCGTSIVDLFTGFGWGFDPQKHQLRYALTWYQFKRHHAEVKQLEGEASPEERMDLNRGGSD